MPGPLVGALAINAVRTAATAGAKKVVKKQLKKQVKKRAEIRKATEKKLKAEGKFDDKKVKKISRASAKYKMQVRKKKKVNNAKKSVKYVSAGGVAKSGKYQPSEAEVKKMLGQKPRKKVKRRNVRSS